MRRLSVAVFAAAMAISARSAHASTITINDTFADNHIEVTLALTSDFTSSSISSNCTLVSGDLYTCTEGAPIVLTGNFNRSLNSLGDANVNIWDDPLHTTISDTLSFAFTNITSTTATGTITFRSGSGVVAFAPASNTVNLLEGAPGDVPVAVEI